jgi:hypothetical protein
VVVLRAKFSKVCPVLDGGGYSRTSADSQHSTSWWMAALQLSGMGHCCCRSTLFCCLFLVSDLVKMMVNSYKDEGFKGG